MRIHYAIAALALLTACATATPYQPADRSGYGYAEQTLESNRTRLTFRGNSLTERETVETYLLYRAAELTRERGYNYFVLTNRDTETRTRTYVDRDPFYPSWRLRYSYYSPYYGWAYDPFYDSLWDSRTTLREVTRYEAVAEIAMFRGAKPAGNENAYSAVEVLENLRGHVVMPPAPQ
ncbi:MAG: hypothetical protein ABW199_06565 [Caulobacterales bacterium]